MSHGSFVPSNLLITPIILDLHFHLSPPLNLSSLFLRHSHHWYMSMTLQNLTGDNRAQILSAAPKTNSTLTMLDLRSNKIRHGGAQALLETLKANPTLTILDLGSNSIGNKGVQVLAEALKLNSTLTTLHLNNNSIGFVGTLVLILACKNSSVINLNGNHLIRNETVLALS